MVGRPNPNIAIAKANNLSTYEARRPCKFCGGMIRLVTSRNCVNKCRYRNPDAMEKARIKARLHRKRYPEQKKKYYYDNQERWKEDRLKKAHGITLADYEGMKKSQGGRCFICNIMPSRLVVDHCHKSRKVRSLLCDNCNTGIGHFKEDPVIMLSAMKYVEAWKEYEDSDTS